MRKKLFRYGFSRGVGLVGYFSILTFLVEVLGQDPVISSLITFVLLFFVEYVLNYSWVFQTSREHGYTFPRFMIITIADFCLNASVMYCTVNVFGWWYIWGQVSAIAIVPPVNFVLNFYWSFRPVETPLVPLLHHKVGEK
jgi:putative flippase GtrA